MAANVKNPGGLEKTLEQEQHMPVFLVDVQGNRTHVVFPIDDAKRMFGGYLQRELQIAFDQADRGESEPWDVEATLTEAHRCHAKQQTS